MSFQPWTGITWLTIRTHPQPLPLSNGGEKKITKPACHSHESGNLRYNLANKKRDARLHEHDSEKCMSFQPWTGITWLTIRTHAQPLPLSNGGEKKITKPACHCRESGNLRHNLAQKRDARLHEHDKQLGKNKFRTYGAVLLSCAACYRYSAPMGRVVLKSFKDPQSPSQCETTKHACHYCANRNLRHTLAQQKTRCPLSRAWQWKMYVFPALNWNRVINHQNPPPTPPFVKWRGEKNHETSMSFPRKWESPTQPGNPKTRCPLTPWRTSPRAWQTN